MSLCRFYMMPFMTSRRYKDGCRWWCLLLCYLCIIKPDDPRCLAVVLPRCLEQNEFLAFARKLILTFLQYLLKSDHWTCVCFVYLQLGIYLSFDHLELNVSFYICSVFFLNNIFLTSMNWIIHQDSLWIACCLDSMCWTKSPPLPQFSHNVSWMVLASRIKGTYL